jgi:rhamnose utilization protein RhaD (predicted bifunctional aldolase and dehydrogenase)
VGPASGSASIEERRRELAGDLLPALRGAVSSQRAKLLISTSRPPRASSSTRVPAALTEVGAACPDHLVHTKRVPLWIPYDPASESLDTAPSGSLERAARYREEYRAYFDDHASDETTCPPTPMRAWS